MKTFSTKRFNKKKIDEKQIHARASAETEPFHKKILKALKISSLPNPKKNYLPPLDLPLDFRDVMEKKTAILT